MDFLILDDEKTIRDATCYLIEDAGHYAEGTTNSADCLQRLKEEKWDAVLLDLHLGKEHGLEVLPNILKQSPGVQVVIFTAKGSIQTAVEAMRLGAVDFLEKPFHREHFFALIARLKRSNQLGRDLEQLRTEAETAKQSAPQATYQTKSAAMKEVMAILTKAAATPATLLILGESGTGKSMAAKALHDASPLAGKPFVTVSCPSLSKELLHSELFGHVKGSFTGALKDHWGKVKAAEGGTLFLDEIGELPLEIQPKLLRLLQEREYERLGENTPRHASVRIMAATNRDLKAAVKAGEFREDLYYRLSVIGVKMPSLRERSQDVLNFAQHYLEFFAQQCRSSAKKFTAEAEAKLKAHHWPGNLRELRNLVERSIILGTGAELDVADLAFSAHDAGSAPPTTKGSGTPPDRLSLEDIEVAHIKRVLQSTSSLQEAGQILGIDQATLYRKRKKLGI